MRSLVPLAVLLFVAPAQSQLHTQLAALAAQAQGRVGIACSLPGTPLACAVNAQEPLPMQSVYKLPIALVALHRVEVGQFTLDTPVPFPPSAIWSRTTHSPLRDEYPQGRPAGVPLRELLRLAVEQSDNMACDLLIRLLGGAPAVEHTLLTLGLPGIHIRSTEQQVNGNPQLQYTNTASAAALLTLLIRLRDSSPLNAVHTGLLLGWMTSSPTGPARLKGALPPGTPVAHKTGTGDDGLVNAINDIGLITLPPAPGQPARRLAVAVLIADSHVPVPAREHIIAEVARTLFDAARGADAKASTPK